MTGYSVFNHAQWHSGGVASEPEPYVVGEKPSEQTVTPEQLASVQQPKRVRSPRGWAVEAGLGLGPQFNDRNKK